MNVISACHSCEHNAFIYFFDNAHFTRVCCWCKECTLIKLTGLLLTIMAGQNDIYSCLVQAEKEKFWASTLSHKMCPRTTTEAKLLILVQISSDTDFKVAASGRETTPRLNVVD